VAACQAQTPATYRPAPVAYIESVHENCYRAQSQPITR